MMFECKGSGLVPAREFEGDAMFSLDEIVITLHDEKNEGRCFKVKAW